MPETEKPTPTSPPKVVLLRLSESQGIDLATEALELTAIEGRSVSPTEVARRRLFGLGRAA